MRKRMLCMLYACLIAGTLTGCQIPFLPEKVTAESLLENSMKNATAVIDADIEIDMDAGMDMESLGVSGQMDMSVGIDANIKSDGKYGYVNGDVRAKVLGMSVNQDMETYIDYKGGTTYTYNNETKQWEYTETDNVKFNTSKLDTDMFKNPELKETKKDEDYVVTAEVDYDSVEDIMGDGIETTGDFSGIGDLSKMEFDAEITFSRDEKELKSVKIEAEEGNYDGMVINNLSVLLEINQMGGDIEVDIPKDIIKNAVKKEEDGSSVIDGLPEPDSGNIPSIDTQIDGEVSGNLQDGQIDAVSSAAPDAGMDTDGDNATYSIDAAVNDSYGKYGSNSFYYGINLNAFTSDGWNTQSSDPAIFASFNNAKYENASLYLYGNKNSVTPDDLMKDGVYGYDIDVTFCKDGNLPHMAFKNLTWGASRDDIIAAYGKPYLESADEGTIYPYILTYKSDDGAEMKFYISEGNNVKGLSKVSFINFSKMSN